MLHDNIIDRDTLEFICVTDLLAKGQNMGSLKTPACEATDLSAIIVILCADKFNCTVKTGQS